MTDKLLEDPQPDGFSSESPLRAFTDWQPGDLYAIGKGFRPSVAHLAVYLSAIENKEGWRLLQVLYADDPHRMSLVFGRSSDQSRTVGKVPELAMGYGDDPINPKHYDGTACADIGERLSANGYQVLKYCWRVGYKDDPCIELGKAVWYGEREYTLITTKGFPNTVSANWRGLKPESVEAWLEERIAGRSQFTQDVARRLWEGYDAKGLRAILDTINEQKVHLDCGRGLAI